MALILIIDSQFPNIGVQVTGTGEEGENDIVPKLEPGRTIPDKETMRNLHFLERKLDMGRSSRKLCKWKRCEGRFKVCTKNSQPRPQVHEHTQLTLNSRFSRSVISKNSEFS